MAGKYIDLSMCVDIDWRSAASIEKMSRSEYRALVLATIPKRFPSDDVICRGEGPRAVIAGTSQYFDACEEKKK